MSNIIHENIMNSSLFVNFIRSQITNFKPTKKIHDINHEFINIAELYKKKYKIKS